MDLLIAKQPVLLTIGTAIFVGYLFFLLMRLLLPKRLRSEHIQQRNLVIKKAKRRKQQILQESISRLEKQLQHKREVSEEQLEELRQSIEASTEELDAQEEFASKEQSRLDKLRNQVDAKKAKLETISSVYAEKQAKADASLKQLQEKLAETAGVSAESLQRSITESQVSDYTIESQKRVKNFIDDLQTTSKRLADRNLSRVLARYEPNFVWPKPTSHIELVAPRVADQLRVDNANILSSVAAFTDGVDINFVQEKPSDTPAIRFGGGYGIHKEAARLALEESVGRGRFDIDKIKQSYDRHLNTLTHQAKKLGRRAAQELKLDGLHPVIQEMIGALNWRTSYRQNQFFHSLEVAKLAGIIANEIGVDPDQAKRCGILHDIGKGLDYKIEGSHAVISGDYADRFGESKLICDTVMSHHNDLVLETPLSYVLKSADTLSGARPGARVNLEEGYQIRLSAIEEAARSFPGIQKIAIMNGGREVHIDVNHKKIHENQLEEFTKAVAKKIETDVAFPGQIKVLVTRRFESTAVA